MTPDPRPAKRYRASQAEWSDLHEAFEDDRCWCCDGTWTELHHILNRSHSGDDRIANLAAVCRECHSRIEARDSIARSLMRQALMPSNYAYLRGKLGYELEGWLQRNYPVGLARAKDVELTTNQELQTTNLELNQALDFKAISKDDKPTLTDVSRTNVA